MSGSRTAGRFRRTGGVKGRRKRRTRRRLAARVGRSGPGRGGSRTAGRFRRTGSQGEEDEAAVGGGEWGVW